MKTPDRSHFLSKFISLKSYKIENFASAFFFAEANTISQFASAFASVFAVCRHSFYPLHLGGSGILMKPKQRGVESLDFLRGLPVKGVLLLKGEFSQICVEIEIFISMKNNFACGDKKFPVFLF